MNAPETLLEAVSYFSNPENAFQFFKEVRWPNGVRCPHCGSDKVTFLANAKVWKCKTVHPKQKFSAKVGTIFEDSPIGLEKWLPAMWLAANCKNGISSYELHRALGVTQKTAWFMLQRIRLAMQDGSIEKMKGQVESDETFIGAKARNMHFKVRKKVVKGTGPTTGKTAVFGLLERNTGGGTSRVRLKVMDRIRARELDPSIRDNVEKGAEVITDAFPSYHRLSDEYIHNVIDHAESYVNGHVHTNGLENFWSLLKRGLKGTYVNVEPFHLFRYLDEQAFRFNERKDNDQGRFVKALQGVIGKGLKYAKLIAAEGGDGPCPETWQIA
jgi:hypothetical protein